MALLQACSCSHRVFPDAGGSDADVADVLMDGGALDAGGCDDLEEYRSFDFVLDGVRVSYCQPVRGETRWFRTNPGRPEYRLVVVYPVLPTDPEFEYLPTPPLCGATVVIDNVWPPETGVSGEVEPFQRFVGADEAERLRVRGMVGLTYDSGDEACAVDRERLEGVATGGSWEIVEGAMEPGEFVTVEARDVEFEPFLGHRLRFNLIRWRARLAEPFYPGPG